MAIRTITGVLTHAVPAQPTSAGVQRKTNPALLLSDAFLPSQPGRPGSPLTPEPAEPASAHGTMQEAVAEADRKVARGVEAHVEVRGESTQAVPPPPSRSPSATVEPTALALRQQDEDEPVTCPPGEEPTGGSGAMWDVFFDAREGTETRQNSPLILDLNGNGQADITGSNITGNRVLEGTTVRGFDLNPSARQWATKTMGGRPRFDRDTDARPLPDGSTAQVFDAQGNLVRTVSASALRAMADAPAWRAAGGDMGFGLSGGWRVDFRGPNGTLVGELRNDATAQMQNDARRNGNVGDRCFVYFSDNRNENEWTKPWSPTGGGDGLLVWDVDGDGLITSGKELFGHVDLQGRNAFANGYEKLAHYFDENHDGVVEGAELAGLKIWEDRNGDGVTQAGELVELSRHNVTSLNTRFSATDMRSSYGTSGATAPAPSGAVAPRPHGSGARQERVESTTSPATGAPARPTRAAWLELFMQLQIADALSAFERIFPR